MRKAAKPHIDDLRTKAATPIITPENALRDGAQFPQRREEEREEMRRKYGDTGPCGVNDGERSPWKMHQEFQERFGESGGFTLAKDNDDPTNW